MDDDRKETDLTRRTALRWMAAAAPAIAVMGGARAAEETKTEPKAEEKPKLSDDGRYVIKSEPGLTDAERERLEKQLPAFEEALRKLRAFHLPDDVEPAFRFSALRASGERR